MAKRLWGSAAGKIVKQADDWSTHNEGREK